MWFVALTDLSGIYYPNLILHSVILSTALIPQSNGLILFLNVIIADGLGSRCTMCLLDGDFVNVPPSPL